MKTLFNIIKSLGNVRVAISQTEEKLTISLIPDITGIKDEAVKLLQPLHISARLEDTEEQICDLILEFAPKAIEELDSMRVYQEAIDKMANEKAEAKAKKELEDKLKKEFKDSVSALEKAFDKNEPKDEEKHTKMFLEFKDKFKDIAGFNTVCNDLQKAFNEKYVSFDLFSQI
jgi:hypothetical protein